MEAICSMFSTKNQRLFSPNYRTKTQQIAERKFNKWPNASKNGW